MTRREIPQAVSKSYYPHSTGRVEYLASAGGFSGALLWRISHQMGQFCLRRWPAEHPTLDRLKWQHAVLRRAGQCGIDFVPAPLPNVHGETWTFADGHLWELTPWMPGAADFFPNQRPEKLAAAMAALAKFHLATVDFVNKGSAGLTQGIAPSATQRLARLQDCRAHWRELTAGVERLADPEMATLAREILAGFAACSTTVGDELSQAATITTPLQPAIRDVWSDHILFTGDSVTGMVDFGALRNDSIAVDISRLLGSLAGDDVLLRQRGLQAYEAVNQLDGNLHQLVQIFDRATTVLAGMNWLECICLQGREFQDRTAVLQRLRVTCERLRHLMQK